jgi:hypothetical protein
MTLEDAFSGAAASVLPLLEKMGDSLDEINERLGIASVQSVEAAHGLAKAGDAAKKADLDFAKLSSDLDQAGNALLILGGVIEGAFVVAATKGFKLLMDEEKNLAGLTGWLGDTGDAYRTLGEERAFAFEAGWSEADISGGDPLLLAMGIDPKNLAHTRMVISDLARSMGKEYVDAVQSVMSGSFGMYRSLKFEFGVDIKAEDFEEAGRFAGMTIVDALEQIIRERGKEVGEWTGDFADTITAQLARVQSRLDDVLREGTRALFEAIGDDLNNLLDWFDQAAKSGELEEMIRGLASGLEMVFGVVHNLLGVFTGLMDFFGAENVAKIAAFVAKWALLTGVASKITGAVVGLIGAIQKAGGVMAWFAANPATIWITVIGAAIGGVMLLFEALDPGPVDEIGDAFINLTDEVEKHKNNIYELTSQYDDANKKLADLNKEITKIEALGQPVADSYITQRDALVKLTAELENNIDRERQLMAIKAVQANVEYLEAAPRLETLEKGMDYFLEIDKAMAAKDYGKALFYWQQLTPLAESGEFSLVDLNRIGTGILEAYQGEGAATYQMGAAGFTEEVAPVYEELALVEAKHEALKGYLEPEIEGRGGWAPENFGEATAASETTAKTGGAPPKGDGGGTPAEVNRPRAAYSGLQFAAARAGGETKQYFTFNFNVPVDESMAKYVGEIVKTKVGEMVARTKVL